MAENPDTIQTTNNPPPFIADVTEHITINVDSLSIDDVADEIVSEINGHPILGELITAVATGTGNEITITADKAGTSGNNIVLSAEFESNITKTGDTLSGGIDQNTDYMNRIDDDLILFNYVGSDILSALIIDEVVDYFTGSTDQNNIGFFRADTVAVEKHNKELQIGTGGSDNDSTLWVGTPQKVSFNEDNDEKRIATDGELKPPANTDFFVKMVSDTLGNYAYGHNWKGNTLYMIDLSDGSIERRSPVGQFRDLRSVDFYATGSEDYLWVFDAGASDNGTLFLLNANSLETIRVCPLQDYTPNGWVSDIIMTDNKVWLSHSSTLWQIDKMLYSIDIPDASSSVSLTDNTINLGNYVYGENLDWNDEQGEFIDASTISDIIISIKTGKRCLCRLKKATFTLSGRINVTGTNVNVPGTDTKYTEQLSIGDEIVVSGETRTIASITNDTTATVTVAWGSVLDDTSPDCNPAGSTAIGWMVKYKFESSGASPIYVYWASLVWTDMNNKDSLGDISHKINNGYHLNDIPEGYTTGRIKLYKISDPDNSTNISSIFQDSSHFVWTAGNKIREKSELTATATSSSNTIATISPTKNDSFDDGTGFVSSSFSDSGTVKYIWIKYSGTSKVKKIHFSGSTLTEVDILGDGNNILVTVANSGSGSSFSTSVSHSWRLSYTYDNYQESVLAEGTYVPSAINTEDKNITIIIDDIDKLSKRISHLNLYRSSDNGFHRLIKSIRADDASWVNTTSTKRTIIVTDDYNSGQSYESRTGLSEALTTLNVNYGLSTQINNNLIVGDCFHTEIDDAEFYIFKSKSYRYNTFDWAVDYLRLPEKPNVLQAYNGRIYIFTTDKMFRINPDNMTIEDTFDGVGCISPKSIIVTEYGMFFASNDNIYIHNGRQPMAIGDSILRDANNSKGWQDNTKTFVNLSFDSKRTSLLAFFTIDSGNYCWAYNIARKRWDLWDAPKAVGTFIGKSNEILVASGSAMYEYLGGTSQKSWKWESKAITMGMDTQNKMFYKIKGVGDSHTLKYKVLNSSWSGSWQTTTNEKIASSDKKSKAIRLQLLPTGVTDEIDSLGIIYRTLPIR